MNQSVVNHAVVNLSVVIITRNEERNLTRCLESVKFADEVVVVDSNSEDRTVEIATQFGARVQQVAWKGYGPAKRAAVEMAHGKWILSVDADEEVSPELATEIKGIISSADPAEGYYLPRRTNFLGRWINHSGWYPDYVLRLFLKARGNFNDATVHEEVISDGRTAYARGELRHYSYPDLETYFDKFNRYTAMGAEKAMLQGQTTGWFDLLVRPPVSFVKHYITGQGFRDGKEGLIISVLSSVAVFVKYAKLGVLLRARKNSRKDNNG